MFNSFTGTVTQKGPEGFCLQTAGIEWAFLASPHASSQLKIGQRAKVLCYLQHKEDGMALFGFISEEERSLFLNLLKVEGIGPKAAIKMLGGLSPAEFIAALEAESIETLSRAPGLGKKTAQKVILALKGKLVLGPAETAAADLGPDAELALSLSAMGFDKKAAIAALAAARKELGSAADEGALIRKAIIALS